MSNKFKGNKYDLVVIDDHLGMSPDIDDYPAKRDELYFCWLWHGARGKEGYGLISRSSRKVAHRVVWEQEFGPVPDGQVLDHVCRRRHCVNPMHLDPVTQSTNERRKSWRTRTRRVQCRFGHDLRKHGRLTPEGGKVCRECE